MSNDSTWNGTAWVPQSLSDTVAAVEAPTNADATTDVPNNYLICDRTGFRVTVAEGLKEEWNGLMVWAESWEPRHPQDFVRSKGEQITGSIRPEQDDNFLTTNEVTAADL